jgi:hypothetical protein
MMRARHSECLEQAKFGAIGVDAVQLRYAIVR